MRKDETLGKYSVLANYNEIRKWYNNIHEKM